MEYEYPPLPVKNVIVNGLWEEEYGPYSADQMREYAKPLLERIHALEGAILTIASVLKEDL